MPVTDLHGASPGRYTRWSKLAAVSRPKTEDGGRFVVAAAQGCALMSRLNSAFWGRVECPKYIYIYIYIYIHTHIYIYLRKEKEFNYYKNKNKTI